MAEKTKERRDNHTRLILCCSIDRSSFFSLSFVSSFVGGSEWSTLVFPSLGLLLAFSTLLGTCSKKRVLLLATFFFEERSNGFSGPQLKWGLSHFVSKSRGVVVIVVCFEFLVLSLVWWLGSLCAFV